MTEQFAIVARKPDDIVAIRLTAQGFGQPITDDFANSAIDVLNRCEAFQTAISGQDETLGYIGYTPYILDGGNTLYINTIMVDSSCRGKGIADSLLAKAVMTSDNIKYVGFKTQSARMYRTAQRIFNNIFPTLKNEDIPENVCKIGNELASKRGGSFPVHNNLYKGKSLYAALPEHEKLPEFYKFIDFEAGDAMLCVCRVGAVALAHMYT